MSFLDLITQRYQELFMSCPTPCSNCSCETVYTSDYQEIDASPLSTQQRKYFEEYDAAPKSPVNFFEEDCKKNPSAKGCLIYD